MKISKNKTVAIQKNILTMKLNTWSFGFLTQSDNRRRISAALIVFSFDSADENKCDVSLFVKIDSFRFNEHKGSWKYQNRSINAISYKKSWQRRLRKNSVHNLEI